MSENEPDMSENQRDIMIIEKLTNLAKTMSNTHRLNHQHLETLSHDEKAAFLRTAEVCESSRLFLELFLRACIVWHNITDFNNVQISIGNFLGAFLVIERPERITLNMDADTKIRLVEIAKKVIYRFNNMVSLMILEPSLGDFFKIQLIKGLSKNFFEDVKEYTLLIQNLMEQKFHLIIAKLRNALEKMLSAMFHIARNEERIDQQDLLIQVIIPT
jgi:hypothetical protein